MLISKIVQIVITKRNIGFFRKKGYDAEMMDTLSVFVGDLPENSHCEVGVSCDNCKKIRKMKYFEYKRYGDKYMCRQCSEGKRQETSMKNWGVDNPSKSDIIKQKISDTLKKLKS